MTQEAPAQEADDSKAHTAVGDLRLHLGLALAWTVPRGLAGQRKRCRAWGEGQGRDLRTVAWGANGDRNADAP